MIMILVLVHAKYVLALYILVLFERFYANIHIQQKPFTNNLLFLMSLIHWIVTMPISFHKFIPVTMPISFHKFIPKSFR
jgi:hypothetical protein